MEGPVIAVGKTIHIEADNLATICHYPESIFFHGRRRAKSYILPVADLAGSELGRNKLPEKFTGLLIKAHQVSAIHNVALISGGFVIRSGKHFPKGYRSCPIGLRAQLGDPANVLCPREVYFLRLVIHFPRVDLHWQVGRISNHVSRPIAAPCRPFPGPTSCRRDGGIRRTPGVFTAIRGCLGASFCSAIGSGASLILTGRESSHGSQADNE